MDFITLIVLVTSRALFVSEAKFYPLNVHALGSTMEDVQYCGDTISTSRGAQCCVGYHSVLWRLFSALEGKISF